MLLVAALVAAVVATAVGILRFGLSDSARTYHVDFDVYRAGGRAVLDGQPLYEGLFHVYGIHLPFTYPPLSAIIFTPLAALPDGVGYWAFTALSLVAVVFTTAVVLVALIGESGCHLPRRRALGYGLLLLPVAVWLWPLTHTLEFGQINILLMAMVVADLLLPRTPWPRGTLVGFAAALKLTPAVFVLYPLVRRQWRDAVTVALSGVVFTALAWIILPADSHRYWFSTLSDPGRIGDLAYAANQSLRGALARFTDDPYQSWMWISASLIVSLVIVAAVVRQVAAGAVTAAVCTTSLLALLVSPVSWAHHWVWVLPMLLVTGVAWWNNRRIAALVLFIATLLVSTILPVHLYLTSGHGAEADWSLWMKLAAPSFVWCGLLWAGVTLVAPDAVRLTGRDS